MPNPYKVYNFQIPVPLGDCSVHLLFCDGCVHNAFIMDGGTDSGGKNAHEMITESLQWIDGILLSEYEETYKADWTFQSWVVTHWDKDHYKGVVDFFENQRIAFPIVKNGTGRRFSLRGKPIFSTKGNGTIQIESTTDKASTGSLPKYQKLKGSRSYFADTVMLMCGARPPNEEWDYSLQKSLELMSKRGLKMEAKNMGRSLIGVDLFSNELVLDPPKRYHGFVVEPKKKKQPKKSEIEKKKENSAILKQVKSTTKSQISVIPMELVKPKVPRREIVLNIGENTQRTKKVATVSKREPPVFVVIGADGFSLAKSKRHKIPNKNETSILALVYWREQKRASYFTGGDGNPKVERDVLQHLIDKVMADKVMAPPKSVKTMKLDHHGSSGENLATWDTATGRKNTSPVVDIIKPRYILVTPGDHYEHPCWDVLFYLFHYIEDQNLEREALWTTRTPYWMNMLKPWGNIINMKKNERLQNLHQARAENVKGLFSVLDCFEGLQDFIKEQIIDKAKARKAESGNHSKGPKDGDIEVEKEPLTKGRGRRGRETEKDKAEQDADTGKKQRRGPPKKKRVAMLNPALLEDEEDEAWAKKAIKKFPHLENLIKMAKGSKMDPATREANRIKLMEKINNGQLVELDEADWESEEEDKWDDRQYIKAEEKDLIWALKDLWKSACEQKLPELDNMGDFYLVWFACVEEESEDCVFQCQKIDQCNLETQNNNWKSGAQQKQRGRGRGSRGIRGRGTRGRGGNPKARGDREDDDSDSQKPAADAPKRGRGRPRGGRGDQTLQSVPITAVSLSTPLTSTNNRKRSPYEAKHLGIHKYELRPRKQFRTGVLSYTRGNENRSLSSSSEEYESFD